LQRPEIKSRGIVGGGGKEFEADPNVFASNLMMKPKKRINNYPAQWIIVMARG